MHDRGTARVGTEGSGGSMGTHDIPADCVISINIAFVCGDFLWSWSMRSAHAKGYHAVLIAIQPGTC